ncbi:hypothetical protein [Sedimentitalea nanhaiensis]|uniref:Flp pilus assembly protein, pilin Flp n=1 Tax=Sedimentitalea nanhaiensis TaxID=999627 RepID=A0A1I7AXZ4_9RHOB|nr:hypothetical protein [Sedimentitalea nanhaiensis]SFT79810.1 hypothetical protein SAMN05216236_10817 [Sedimentitalea nanhaiensis]
MINIMKTFLSDQEGAVTVDWVVLCAAVVALSAIGMNKIADNTLDLGGAVGTEIASQAE